MFRARNLHRLIVWVLCPFVAPFVTAQEPLPDKALRGCVDTLMQEHRWTAPEQVTEIECHGKGIQSVEGVARFTGLEKLSLYDNRIDSAHLSGLPRLAHLNLAQNQLRSITLSELPALKELYLFRNRLQTLSLTDLPALTTLRANGNRMTDFHYQDVPALKKIYLFDNELEHIDIHHLPALDYMDVRENPMPDELYEDMDRKSGSTILHDGNADDW